METNFIELPEIAGVIEPKVRVEQEHPMSRQHTLVVTGKFSNGKEFRIEHPFDDPVDDIINELHAVIRAAMGQAIKLIEEKAKENGKPEQTDEPAGN